ncbi:hypothetical protein DFS34DRAFT_644286 [Phlyctochytrium arcticum]|nr:hypothetical protein DFS34DRAFT_644286 [Phlyctochytrium arcticum]
MWLLQKVSSVSEGTTSSGCTVRLRPDAPISVGRQDADIVINDDRSVSRRHAVIAIDQSEEDSGAKITLDDGGSKFGTYIHNKGGSYRVASTVSLQAGDEIKFGVNQSVFRLVHQKLVFCCSGLRAKQRGEVQQFANALGAKVMKEWTNECTHLVVETLKVTLKVVLALAQCKPIISVKWLSAAVARDWRNFALPPFTLHTAEVVDQAVDLSNVSLAPNVERGRLFKDFQFIVFSDDELRSLLPLITSSGGTITKWESPLSSASIKPLSEFFLKLKNPAIITPLEEQHEILVQDAAARVGLRLIPQDEVAKAIIFVTTDQFCNSRVALSGSSRVPTQSEDHMSAPPASSGSELQQTAQSGFDDFFDGLLEIPLPSEAKTSPAAVEKRKQIHSHAKSEFKSPAQPAPSPARISTFRTPTLRKEKFPTLAENVQSEETPLLFAPPSSSNVVHTSVEQTPRKSVATLPSNVAETPSAQPQAEPQVVDDQDQNHEASTNIQKAAIVETNPIIPEKTKPLRKHRKIELPVPDTTEERSVNQTADEDQMLSMEADEKSPLETNLVRIDIVSLIAQQVPFHTPQRHQGPNYKRFRKVMPIVSIR